ncbi:hypothetical protein Pcinc_029179 [Petrolisthes cinctipes]|uniref:Reelin domain-containing protein n=1 Tax=Petrolisthes cinctipes TaxID=88211 RepID=A0AAE1F1G5_PETCI|nr:hypothetical protein Pcinc_029179 [Petrolisthes cinctipes]
MAAPSRVTSANGVRLAVWNSYWAALRQLLWFCLNTNVLLGPVQCNQLTFRLVDLQANGLKSGDELLSLLLLLCVGVSRGYPNGAPDCLTLIPCHEATTVLDNALVNQYVIHVTDIDTRTLNVTLTSTGPSPPFKGFLLRANAQVPNQGHFILHPTDPYHQLTCSDLQTAVTHSGPQARFMVTLTWAILIPGPKITFEATVVKEYPTYVHNIVG